MTPAEVSPLGALLMCWANGNTIRAEENKLVVSGPRPPPEMLEVLRRLKPELMRLLCSDRERAA